MDDQQNILDWLTLLQIPGLTPRRAAALMAHFSYPQALLSADAAGLADLPDTIRSPILALQDQGDNHPAKIEARRQQDLADAMQIKIITRDTALYPPLLKQIAAPPPVLYVRGDVLALSDPQLAVVGARKATPAANTITQQWSQALAAAGLVITSGLALGVDGHAHQGALTAGGKTIAVLAHGMDTLYPRSHNKLAEAIAENGALISEFAFGEAPRREHFPQRNRIISGLSLGVLVVEAALRSGSLITARYALEQNREVLAMPGSVNNVMARGCHYLIKQGATLVENADDILQALALPLSFAVQEKAEEPDKQYNDSAQAILQAMDFAPTHTEELLKATGLDAATLAGELTLLELDGLVANMGGLYQRLA